MGAHRAAVHPITFIHHALGVKTMSHHLKQYGLFLAFLVATNILVKPMVQNLNVPLLKEGL